MTDSKIHEYGLTTRCVASRVDGKLVCTKKHTVYVPKAEQDALIAAVINLEVAVDDYTAAEWHFECKRRQFGYHALSTSKSVDAQYLRDLRYAVIDASTDVAAAMTDGDVSLMSSAYAESIIPFEIMPAAAQAEIDDLRARRAAHAARRTHPHPIDGTHEGLRRDCSACEAEDAEA